MPDKIFDDYQGPSIKVGGICYRYDSRTLDPANALPADIEGFFADCFDCEAESSTSSSSSSSSSLSSSSSSIDSSSSSSVGYSGSSSSSSIDSSSSSSESTVDNLTYKNCDTDAVVARFDSFDAPSHDYVWIYSGSYIKCYFDSVESQPATDPVPCFVEMDTDPGSCANLDLSAFNDNFDDSSFDTCRHTDSSGGEGSISETTELFMEFQSITNEFGDAEFTEFTPDVIGSDDFDFKVNYSNLDIKYANTGTPDYGNLFIQATIGSYSYFITLHKYHDSLITGNPTIWPSAMDRIGYHFRDTSQNPQTTDYGSSHPTSGSLQLIRSGSTLTAKIGGTTVATATVSGSLTSLYCRLGGRTGQTQGQSSVDVTGTEYS